MRHLNDGGTITPVTDKNFDQAETAAVLSSPGSGTIEYARGNGTYVSVLYQADDQSGGGRPGCLFGGPAFIHSAP